jgi:hypothetical protein|tara:strand:+ start:15594 stop:16346 length:753 start_codon:yes stop_codon:yes gene_type:complete
MEIIKRKILLKKSSNSKIAQSNERIRLKIPLYQTIENMGLMTDMPTNTMIHPTSSGLPLEFTSQGVTSDWYKQGDTVVYASDSKLNEVKSYDKNEQYKIDFDMKKESYSNFESTTIIGVDRVTNIDGDVITYVLNTKRDGLIGTTGQTTGTLYTDNTLDRLFLPDELDNNITKTRVQYESEGWNKTNTSLTPQIQEEYLLGVISPPEVKSDVFIDRSTFSVLDKHLRLSEIESLDHLKRYGNGFYNINRD